MPVIIDDDVFLPGIPSGAGASTTQIANVSPRIFVIDDLDQSGQWGYTAAPLCSGDFVGTLSLVYNDTLARVEITATNITDPYTFVKLERSVDQQHWYTVRGGVSIQVVNGGFTRNDYEFTNGVVNYYRITSLAPIGCAMSAVASVTPAVTVIWIKSVNRPFLNISMPSGCTNHLFGSTPIEMLADISPVIRRARSGVFPIINRTYAVAVNDIRTGREWNIQIRTFTEAALQSVDFLFASGDVLLIQVPTGCAESVEHGYITAMDMGYTRHHRYRHRAVWDIPVVEVAAPGPDIIYAETTWQTVINLYGSWAAVMAANPTWAAVLALLPSPSEVIVP